MSLKDLEVPNFLKPIEATWYKLVDKIGGIFPAFLDLVDWVDDRIPSVFVVLGIILFFLLFLILLLFFAGTLSGISPWNQLFSFSIEVKNSTTGVISGANVTLTSGCSPESALTNLNGLVLAKCSVDKGIILVKKAGYLDKNVLATFANGKKISILLTAITPAKTMNILIKNDGELITSEMNVFLICGTREINIFSGFQSTNGINFEIPENCSSPAIKIVANGYREKIVPLSGNNERITIELVQLSTDSSIYFITKKGNIPVEGANIVVLNSDGVRKCEVASNSDGITADCELNAGSYSYFASSLLNDSNGTFDLTAGERKTVNVYFSDVVVNPNVINYSNCTGKKPSNAVVGMGSNPTVAKPWVQKTSSATLGVCEWRCPTGTTYSNTMGACVKTCSGTKPNNNNGLNGIIFGVSEYYVDLNSSGVASATTKSWTYSTNAVSTGTNPGSCEWVCGEGFQKNTSTESSAPPCIKTGLELPGFCSGTQPTGPGIIFGSTASPLSKNWAYNNSVTFDFCEWNCGDNSEKSSNNGCECITGFESTNGINCGAISGNNLIPKYFAMKVLDNNGHIILNPTIEIVSPRPLGTSGINCDTNGLCTRIVNFDSGVALVSYEGLATSVVSFNTSETIGDKINTVRLELPNADANVFVKNLGVGVSNIPVLVYLVLNNQSYYLKTVSTNVKGIALISELGQKKYLFKAKKDSLVGSATETLVKGTNLITIDLVKTEGNLKLNVLDASTYAKITLAEGLDGNFFVKDAGGIYFLDPNGKSSGTGLNAGLSNGLIISKNYFAGTVLKASVGCTDCLSTDTIDYIINNSSGNYGVGSVSSGNGTITSTVFLEKKSSLPSDSNIQLILRGSFKGNPNEVDYSNPSNIVNKFEPGTTAYFLFNLAILDRISTGTVSGYAKIWLDENSINVAKISSVKTIGGIYSTLNPSVTESYDFSNRASSDSNAVQAGITFTDIQKNYSFPIVVGVRVDGNSGKVKLKWSAVAGLTNALGSGEISIDENGHIVVGGTGTPGTSGQIVVDGNGIPASWQPGVNQNYSGGTTIPIGQQFCIGSSATGTCKDLLIDLVNSSGETISGNTLSKNNSFFAKDDMQAWAVIYNNSQKDIGSVLLTANVVNSTSCLLIRDGNNGLVASEIGTGTKTFTKATSLIAPGAEVRIPLIISAPQDTNGCNADVNISVSSIPNVTKKEFTSAFYKTLIGAKIRNWLLISTIPGTVNYDVGGGNVYLLFSACTKQYSNSSTCVSGGRKPTNVPWVTGIDVNGVFTQTDAGLFDANGNAHTLINTDGFDARFGGTSLTGTSATGTSATGNANPKVVIKTTYFDGFTETTKDINLVKANTGLVTFSDAPCVAVKNIISGTRTFGLGPSPIQVANNTSFAITLESTCSLDQIITFSTPYGGFDKGANSILLSANTTKTVSGFNVHSVMEEGTNIEVLGLYVLGINSTDVVPANQAAQITKAQARIEFFVRDYSGNFDMNDDTFNLSAGRASGKIVNTNLVGRLDNFAPTVTLEGVSEGYVDYQKPGNINSADFNIRVIEKKVEALTGQKSLMLFSAKLFAQNNNVDGVGTDWTAGGQNIINPDASSNNGSLEFTDAIDDESYIESVIPAGDCIGFNSSVNNWGTNWYQLRLILRRDYADEFVLPCTRNSLTSSGYSVPDFNVTSIAKVYSGEQKTILASKKRFDIQNSNLNWRGVTLHSDFTYNNLDVGYGTSPNILKTAADQNAALIEIQINSDYYGEWKYYCYEKPWYQGGGSDCSWYHTGNPNGSRGSENGFQIFAQTESNHFIERNADKNISVKFTELNFGRDFSQKPNYSSSFSNAIVSQWKGVPFVVENSQTAGNVNGKVELRKGVEYFQCASGSGTGCVKIKDLNPTALNGSIVMGSNNISSLLGNKFVIAPCTLEDTNCWNNFGSTIGWLDERQNPKLVWPANGDYSYVNASKGALYLIDKNTIPVGFEAKFNSVGELVVRYVGVPQMASPNIDFNIVMSNAPSDGTVKLVVEDYVTTNKVLQKKKFRVKVTGLQNSCVSWDGLVGNKGINIAPKLLFKWNWADINSTTCDYRSGAVGGLNAVSYYCDAAQFTTELFKKLELIQANGLQSSYFANNSVFYVSLMKDTYNSSMLRDYVDYYSSTLGNTNNSFVTSGLNYGLDNLINSGKLSFVINNLSDANLTGTSLTLPYAGVFKAVISVSSVGNSSVNNVVFTSVNSPSVVVTLTPVVPANPYYSFYEMPFDAGLGKKIVGGVEVVDRNNYGFITSGNSLGLTNPNALGVSAFSTVQKSSNAIGTSNSNGLNYASLEKVTDFTKLSDVLLYYSKNKITNLGTMTQFISQPVGVVFDINSVPGRKFFPVYTTYFGNEDNKITQGLKNWKLLASTMASTPITGDCADPEGQRKSSYVFNNGFGENTKYWDSVKYGIATFGSVFYKNASMSDVIFLMGLSGLINLKVGTAVSVDTANNKYQLNEFGAGGTGDVTSLEELINLVKNGKACISETTNLTGGNETKIFWDSAEIIAELERMALRNAGAETVPLCG